MKSMNFLDLGGRGRLEDDRRERGREGGGLGRWRAGMEQLAAAVRARIPDPIIIEGKLKRHRLRLYPRPHVQRNHACDIYFFF